MNKEIELLKYQIKLMKMVIGGDSHPYFMYLLDHEVTEDQTNLLNSLMISMNSRRRRCLVDNRDINDTPVLISDNMLNKLQNHGITTQELNVDKMPNYHEFCGYIDKIMNSDINPKYLLTAMHRQSMFSELCELLLKDS